MKRHYSPCGEETSPQWQQSQVGLFHTTIVAIGLYFLTIASIDHTLSLFPRYETDTKMQNERDITPAKAHQGSK